MLFTRVRDRPHMAWALGVSWRMPIVSWSPSWAMVTSSGKVQASWPLVPFTVTVWPSMLTVTPFGMGTAFFPIRDILVDPAEDFAADVGVARGVVRHDALGRGQDGDPEAILDRLQVRNRGVDATARLRHAGDLGDHRLAVEVLELDLEFRERARLLDQLVTA